jgi:hypothetical protein
MVISGFSAFEGGALNDEKMGVRQRGAGVKGNREFKRSSLTLPKDGMKWCIKRF